MIGEEQQSVKNEDAPGLLGGEQSPAGFTLLVVTGLTGLDWLPYRPVTNRGFPKILNLNSKT
jgi:hypothetical protein